MHLTVLIFAGGQASRMGFVNKGLQIFKDKPLIEWAINIARQWSSEIIISANKDEEKIKEYGYRVLKDKRPSFPGPLAAIEAAQDEVTEWLITMPCDVPLVPVDILTRLLEKQKETEAKALYVMAEEHSQNTFMLIHKSELAKVTPFLEAGERKIGFWLKSIGAIGVDCDGLDGCFLNINTMAELESH